MIHEKKCRVQVAAPKYGNGKLGKQGKVRYPVAMGWVACHRPRVCVVHSPPGFRAVGHFFFSPPPASAESLPDLTPLLHLDCDTKGVSNRDFPRCVADTGKCRCHGNNIDCPRDSLFSVCAVIML